MIGSITVRSEEWKRRSNTNKKEAETVLEQHVVGAKFGLLLAAVTKSLFLFFSLDDKFPLLEIAEKGKLRKVLEKNVHVETKQKYNNKNQKNAKASPTFELYWLSLL